MKHNLTAQEAIERFGSPCSVQIEVSRTGQVQNVGANKALEVEGPLPKAGSFDIRAALTEPYPRKRDRHIAPYEVLVSIPRNGAKSSIPLKRLSDMVKDLEIGDLEKRINTPSSRAMIEVMSEYEANFLKEKNLMIGVYEVMTKPFEHHKILGTIDPTKDDDGNDFLILFMPYSVTAFATILAKEDAVKVTAYSHKVYYAGTVGPSVHVEVTYKPKGKKWHPEGKYPSPFGIYHPMTMERWNLKVHHPRRPGLITGDVDLPIEQQAFRAAYITVEIGLLQDTESKLTFSAQGHFVAPGFIDMHAHFEETILADPRAASKVCQGVTTEVSGNCGCSAFPMCGDALSEWDTQIARFGVSPYWDNAEGFWSAVQAMAPAVNIASFVGHATLRRAIKANTPDITNYQIRRMMRLLEEALDQGALGLSTGLFYAPGSFARVAELEQLFSVLRKKGGLYSTHIRNEGA